jgi:DNA-binding NtrC family response regulator/tetratricopeptide (TPR) repeat protein
MANSRAHELVASGDFRKALEWIDSKGALTQADRILKAHLELEVGDATTAQQLADTLLKEHLAKRDRAFCLDVSGRALARSGSTAQGLSLLQKAISIAEECDSQLHAELLAHYAKALLSWVGVEPALAVLPQLRKVALQTGNRRALVEYHLSRARVSAIRDWWQVARSEIALAASLLEVDKGLDQLWQLRQVQATISTKECQLAAARTHTEEAIRVAREIGSVPFEASSLANLAHITNLAGHHDESRIYIDRAASLLAPFSHIRFALYSTQIDVGLWSSDVDYAKAAVDCGQQLCHHFDGGRFYYRLWFELQHGRWLLHQGDSAGAAALAFGALKDIEALADTNLLFRMRVLAAEAVAKEASREAAIPIANYPSTVTGDLSVEGLAEMNRLSAVLTPVGERVTKAAYLRRAARLLAASELMGPLADVTSTRIAQGIDEASSVDESGTDAATLLESAALMLSLGNHPKALGAELQFIIRALDSRSQTQQVGEVAPIVAETQPSESETRSIVVGWQNGTRYSVSFHSEELSSRPSAAVALEQLVRASLSTKPMQSPEDDIALWPQETTAVELGMIVAAESMRELVDTCRRLAPSNITVLLTGETGTGKELLAKGLHDASPRKDRNFIPFNCTAVAREMLDAQLFGYRRGAFTGAQDAFQGVIRAAAGGTLFLDEIGEISLDVQPKLLRFLESGEIHPLGEPKPIKVDVRVVAATNANLERLVAEGRFREDLFYRLNVVKLLVPPLRERREEIPPLVQYYLERGIQESRKTGLRFAEETMEYLVLYRWPGNVRQLANEVRRLVALAESGAVLMPEHLSHDIRASRRTIPAGERMLAPTEVVVRTDQPLPAAMEHLERTMVQQALKESGGRLEDAAQRLGLSRKGLYLKRQRLGIIETTGAAAESTSATRTDE